MNQNNLLDKSFGPVGTSAGILLFVVGLFVTFTSLYGLILMLIGAFVGFTSTSCVIDLNQKRVKFSNNLFGIVRFGEWLKIEPTMKIGIKRSNRTWRAYSQSNRTLDVEQTDFRIILYNQDDKLILPLKKCKSSEVATKEMELLASELKLHQK